jgi:hypothetical protein
VVIDSRIQAYASIIDNRTGDAVFVPAQAMATDPSPGSWVIPAVASVGGANGTRWQSQLELLNPTEQTSTVTITLIETESEGTPAHQRELDLAGGQVVRIDDVVDELFGLETTGALVLESSTALHSTSRTFTVTTEENATGGSFGQHIPAIAATELLSVDKQASLLQLKENVKFRSNVGFVNPSPDPAVVTIEALDTQGMLQATTTIELAPWEHRQLNRILINLGGVEEATLTLTVHQGTVAAYASVVDNTTGDPVFLPALKHR